MSISYIRTFTTQYISDVYLGVDFQMQLAHA